MADSDSTKEGEYGNAAVGDQSATDKDGAKTARSAGPPQTAQIVHGIETAKPATEEQLKDVKREMNAFERSILKWTRVTAGIYAVTAIFICLQWFVMRSTLDEMKSSGNTSTQQIWRAIDNMNWMAKTADGSLTQSQQSGRTDQRAWLGVGPIDGIPVVGQPWLINVSIKNTGKTPAIHVSPNVNIHVVKLGESFSFGKLRRPDVREFIPPTSAAQASPSVTKKGSVLSRDSSLLFQSETWRVFVYGTVWYEDIFDKPHWTRFCYFWAPKLTAYTACEEYNDADPN